MEGSTLFGPTVLGPILGMQMAKRMTEIDVPLKNALKVKMDAGDLAIGMVVRIMRGTEIAAVAKSAGFDSLYIDLEHCSFSAETISQICLTSAALGVTPLVRLAGLDQAEISRTLSIGAQGIIVPHIERRAEIEAVVEAAKFAPIGNRSLLGMNHATLFRSGPAKETMRKMNDATLVVSMIESAKAVENVEDIASVEGLDMLFLGTNDLCGAYGVPGEYDHPRIREAFEHVAKVCRAKGKHLGIGGLTSRPDIVQTLIGLGARFMSAGSDTAFLMSGATAAAKAFRQT